MGRKGVRHKRFGGANISSIAVIVIEVQLGRMRCVLRTGTDQLPKQNHSELAFGTRASGGRTKRCKDSLKTSNEGLQHPYPAVAAELTLARKPRTMLSLTAVNEGAEGFEKQRLYDLVNKHQVCKDRSFRQRYCSASAECLIHPNHTYCSLFLIESYFESVLQSLSTATFN